MTKQEVMCPARDSVLMATDLYVPDDGAACPAILLRTPYGKDDFAKDPLYSHYEDFVAAGYLIAVQDCRGTGASQGRMNLNAANEHTDGYDAVEWLATLPACNGHVGMYGLSYFGFTQLAAASLRPPHLDAICPFMTLSCQPFGASRMQTLNLGHLGWAYGQLQEHAASYMPDAVFREKALKKLKENGAKLGALSFFLPMDQNPAATLEGVPLLDDYLDLVRGVESKAFWDSIHCPLDYQSMHVASFHATGWLDVACPATIDNYQAARTSSDAYTRDHARLLIGPWTHGGVMPDEVDGVSFGTDSSGDRQDVSGMMLRWFDRYLKGKSVDCFDSRVRYFVGGTNQWRASSEWPPKESKPYTLCLNQEGGFSAQQADAGECALTVDPMDPAPSQHTDAAGHGMLPDWSEIDKRPDVLSFRTASLDTPLTIAGKISLHLNVTTDVPDADFACRLLDVAPDGSARQICAGLTRARHRNGLFQTDFLEPDVETAIEVVAGHAAHGFLPGHKIGIQVMGALYPEHNRSLHTKENYGTSTAWQVAHHQIRIGGENASCLELPVIQ